MDMREYFARIKKTALDLGEFVLITSLETPDGGKAGVVQEVAREIAARLIVERKARPATEEEAASFKESLKQHAVELLPELVDHVIGKIGRQIAKKKQAKKAKKVS